MKKILLFLSVALPLLFAGCSKSNENKAKELINQRLKITLNDFSSYESVEFSKMDSTFSTVNNVPEFNEALRKVKFFRKQGELKLEYAHKYYEIESYENQAEYTESGIALLDSASHYLQIAKKIDSTFVSKFTGWDMVHTFRANNAMGNKIICHSKFYFDKDVSKILNVENLDKN